MEPPLFPYLRTLSVQLLIFFAGKFYGVIHGRGSDESWWGKNVRPGKSVKNKEINKQTNKKKENFIFKCFYGWKQNKGT